MKCALLHNVMQAASQVEVSFVQIAFVSGNTYTFVQQLAAGLFLCTNSTARTGYYPSTGMVRSCENEQTIR